MKKLLMSLTVCILLVVPMYASAHTTELCFTENNDRSVTIYAATYHPTYSLTRGGVIIDGQTYNFTGWTSSLPSDATCVDSCNRNLYRKNYQTVTISSGLQTTTHNLTTTRTSAVEYPLACTAGSGNFGTCTDTDGDGVCDDRDNCPAMANPAQADADSDGLGDVCDECPKDPNNDADDDSVCGNVDYCAGTTADADVPSERLGTNRFTYDGSSEFATNPPGKNGKGKGNAKGPQKSFSIEDTGGCSCAQIIEELGLGKGHEKFGCSISAMEDWLYFLESGGRARGRGRLRARR